MVVRISRNKSFAVEAENTRFAGNVLNLNGAVVAR